MASAIGQCFGSCAGTCAAAGCAQLCTAGTVGSAVAARRLLLVIQAFAIILAIIFFEVGQWSFLPCDWSWLSHLGLCECGDDNTCWSKQMVFRIGLSTMLMFAICLVMSASGCGADVERRNFVGKFLSVPVMALLFMLLPNKFFDVFGDVCSVASILFLAAQAVLLIDFGYTWNEVWHANAVDAARQLGGNGRKWYVAIIAASLILILGALVETILVLIHYNNSEAWGVAFVSFVVAILLLVLSITEWCEHGTLLTSAVVMAYATWLASRTVSAVPVIDNDTSEPISPPWVGLLVGLLTLLSFMDKADPDIIHQSGGNSAQAARLAEEAEEGRAAGAEDTTTPPPVAGFANHSGVHLTAAAYWVSLFTARTSWVSFGSCAAALIATHLLYGWSLVAPKVMTGRDFS